MISLVLLPGLGSSAAAMKQTKLNKLPNVQVITLDYGSNASIASMAASAWAQISAPRVMLLGYSMGGFVAQDMVCQKPERVMGVILVSTTAPTLAQVYADQADLRRLLDLLLTSSSGGNLNPRVVYSETFLTSLTATQRRALMAASKRNALPFEEFLQQLSAVVSLITSDLAPLRLRCFANIPVLVLYGEKDVLIPPRAVVQV